ncbi:MAG: hypothetical protein ABIF71_11630 [Planctomycetota bacterium]
MTDVLIGVQTGTMVRGGTMAGRVLRVLEGVAHGVLGSTGAITEIYGDAEALVARAHAAAERLAEMDIAPSPYLMHVTKMKEIEEGIRRL